MPLTLRIRSIAVRENMRRYDQQSLAGRVEYERKMLMATGTQRCPISRVAGKESGQRLAPDFLLHARHDSAAQGAGERKRLGLIRQSIRDDESKYAFRAPDRRH